MAEQSGWTVDTLKELHEQRFTAMDTALLLKSEELSRRLDILNHAHEQAREVQATYLPRELFDEFKEATARALILREGQVSGIGSSASFLQALVLVAVAIAGLYLALHH